MSPTVGEELLRIELREEADIVSARQRARQVSAHLGFDTQDQVRVATAVSELARNALRHAGGGSIDFALQRQSPQPLLSIRICDSGPGITDVQQAMHGTAASGEPKLGLLAAQRMMDRFELDSRPGRTIVTLGKIVPRRTDGWPVSRLAAIRRELSEQQPHDPTAEIQQQNRELLRSMEELRLRQEELTRLNAELEDTNRGVMALYAELDERATHLRLADETKTRFLSSISHELRTPVNSILALTKILLHRLDGELSAEQDKQVRYIYQAAEQLSTLIDDLLDLRKVESGRIQLRIETFSVVELFGALRGMFKPLAVNEEVTLAIEDPPELPLLHTDQGKVSQILRNLISNALKFTQRGAVRVSARLDCDGETIVFTVADSGLGIPPEYHRHIFEEFTQVENALQGRVKGTGLGLPLSQRLAGLLGGSIELDSAPGRGSTFRLAIPVRLGEQSGASHAAPEYAERILIVDDSEIERYALRQFLASERHEIIEAAGGYEGLRLARQARPDLIFLDLLMPDVHGLEVLKMLKASGETRAVPVVIFTSRRLTPEEREQVAAAAVLMKNELSRESVLNTVRAVRQARGSRHASQA